MSRTAPFSITQTERGNIHVLQLSGVLDGTASAVLDKRVTALLAEPAHRLVLDLSGVSYVASVGVGSLINAHRRVRAIGGQLVLASPSESMREMFTVLHLESILPIHATVDQGIRALG